MGNCGWQLCDPPFCSFLEVKCPYLPWVWAPSFLWNLAVLWNIIYRHIWRGRQKGAFNDWKLPLPQTTMCHCVLFWFFCHFLVEVLVLSLGLGSDIGFFPFCFYVPIPILKGSAQRIPKWEDSTSFVLLNDCWQRLLRRDKSLSLRASERLSLLSSVSFNHLQASQLP